MRRSVSIQIVGLVLVFFVNACGNADIFRGDRGNQQPIPQDLAPNSGVDLEAQPQEVTSIFRAQYEVTVSGIRVGKPLCSGQAELIANSDLNYKISGEITCSKFGPKIDLAELTAQQSTPLDRELARDLPHFGKIARLKQQGDNTFFPSFPAILGPVIQKPEEFASFDYTEEISVRQVSENFNVKQDTGSVRLRALSFGAFQPETYPDEFPNVLHWERSVAEGFTKINRSDAFLYDKVEYWWNTNPIALPRIRIQGGFSNFIQSGLLRKIEGDGGLIIDLSLIEHEVL